MDKSNKNPQKFDYVSFTLEKIQLKFEVLIGKCGKKNYQFEKKSIKIETFLGLTGKNIPFFMINFHIH